MIGEHFERHWEAIQAKLVAAADDMLNDASICSRRTSGGQQVWSIRYRVRIVSGHIRQSAIYLGGDPRILARAREFLDNHKRPQNWDAEAAAFIRIAGQLVAAIG